MPPRVYLRPNPPAEWIHAEVPELTIVDEPTWEAAQARHALYAGRPLNRCHRPRHAFSGLLHCAKCGSGYAVRRRDELACTGRHNRGICDNPATIRIADLELRVLDGLQQRLLAPDAIRTYTQEYHAERARLRNAEHRRAVELVRREAEILAALDRLIDQVAKGHIAGERVGGRIAELEAEHKAVSAERAALQKPDDVVTLHPKMIEHYKTRVADLAVTLKDSDPERRRPAIAILRDLVDRIEIGPPAALGAPAIIVAHGLLPRVLAFANARRPAVNDRTASMVAEEGFGRSRLTVKISC